MSRRSCGVHSHSRRGRDGPTTTPTASIMGSIRSPGESRTTCGSAAVSHLSAALPQYLIHLRPCRSHYLSAALPQCFHGCGFAAVTISLLQLCRSVFTALPQYLIHLRPCRSHYLSSAALPQCFHGCGFAAVSSPNSFSRLTRLVWSRVASRREDMETGPQCIQNL